jgi:hypothetical protein
MDIQQMKFSPVRSILARTLATENSTINVLTAPTHSPMEAMLCAALPNCQFYAYRKQGSNIINQWNPIRVKPDSYHLLPDDGADHNIPDCDFHLCLIHNVGAQHPHLYRYAQMLNLPTLAYYHTMPPYGIDPQGLAQYQQLPYDHHVFITELSRTCWGFQDHPNSSVIYHGAELDLFKPNGEQKQQYALTIGNEATSRYFELGFDEEQKLVQGFPYRHIGTDERNPKMHNPVTEVHQLVKEINRAQVFLNCARWSPFPKSLVEAISCGSAILTVNSCGVPDVMQHKVNCMMYPQGRVDIGRKMLQEMLNNPDMCASLGREARKLAETFFSPTRFANEWKTLLWKTIKQS